MALIRFLVHRSLKVVIFAVLAGIISGGSNVLLLGLINDLLVHGPASRPNALWIFLGLCALVPISRLSSELLLNRLGQQSVADLRMSLSRRFLAVPLPRLEQIGPSRILSVLTEDIPTITNIVAILPNICINFAVFVACLLYLGWLSPLVFGGVAVIMVVGILSYQWPILFGMRYARKVRRLSDDLYGHFRALTDGTKELKLHAGRRAFFLQKQLDTTAGRYRDENIAAMRIYSIAASWGQILVFVVIGSLLFGLPRLNLGSTEIVTAFTVTLLFLMTPLQVIMNSVPNFSRAAVSLRHVEETGLELSDEAKEVVMPAHPHVALPPAWQEIALRGITHAYQREGEDGEFILGPVDLTLRPGTLLFIVGGNGSGKTTLAKVMTGLYLPDEGEILLDGQVVNQEGVEVYRRLFSAVFSDFYLFPQLGGLGDGEVSEAAEGYLRRFNLHKRVEIEDNCFSTVDVSQGQRKRLALLSAYLEDRPIYLFDEWAADQDPIFKEIFYRELLPELKKRGKTAVVITHDDRYFGLSDHLIKLENGSVVASVDGDQAATVVPNLQAG